MFRMLVITSIGFYATGCLKDAPQPSDNLQNVQSCEPNCDEEIEDPVAPTKPVVAILPGSPTAEDNLNCMVTLPSDSDYGTVLYSVTWNKDQVQSDLTSATVTSDHLEPGSEWSCVVTATLSGEPAFATASEPASVTVQLAGPSEPAIEIQPASPTESDNLFCVLNVPSEGEGTISYQYQWTRDGGETPNTTPVLLADETLVSEEWSCTVTPFDAEGAIGSPATQAITILSESP